jgi:hypothetical protein
MGNVLFARPRYVYDSYSDLYRLIELSGYPLIYFDEIDADSDNTYILTVANGENMGGWPDAHARLILWDLEWHVDGAPAIPGLSEVWASDAWYAAHINARYVLMGSHDGLALEPITRPQTMDYDGAMLAYLTHRRGHMHNELKRIGLRLAPNSWGTERHTALSHTRAMLHVHQHDAIHTVAPLRFALAAAYQLPVISEQVADRGGIKHSAMLTSDYANYANFAHMWLIRNEARILEDYGRSLHGLLCRDQTFRASVEAAL